MIDTNSPDYQAGLRAGRLSYTFTVVAAGHGVLVNNHPIAAVALAQRLPGAHGTLLAPGLIMFVSDSMPGVENWPDSDG